MSDRTARLRRSCLAVPGSSEKMLAKAATLDVDEVFLDLEDAVAPLEKTDDTRRLIADSLRDQSWKAKTKAVRVNAVSTPWCHRDIIHVVEHAGEALDCIMLPKVERPGDVEFADRLLSQLEMEAGRKNLIGLELQIESPRGLMNVEAIAGSSSRIETLIFGPGDFAASVGMPQLTVGAVAPDYSGDQWHYVLWRILTAARAYGLQAIDGPYAMVRDIAGFRAVASRSRSLGYDGKWVIHPDQIAACHEIFTPSRDQFLRATKILEAYDVATAEKRLGAVMYENEMIDEASRKMAEQIVEQGQASGLTV
jgi:citrate lyase subunit beta/citryl-CoA lyase